MFTVQFALIHCLNREAAQYLLINVREHWVAAMWS